ncbi:phosphodiester glycosidase family protein [Pseudonocardia nigra]|uniref:phosphodiester glycosidase family protein n=1 Tax=Pseudonocardia nigra TaxID=1921578 RepID=UPI001C5FDD35|nr:phosphodiester glycosidase family protein [Pseudonocardia nigra]
MQLAGRVRPALGLLLTAVLALAPGGEPTPPPEPPPEGLEQVLGELLPAQPVAPGVTHREFTTTDAAGQVMGDVVEVALDDPAVRTDLVTAGAVAARASVAAMANTAGAVAAINGDFFDIGSTSAPAGPAVQSTRPLKAAVPQGRRGAPAVPGAEMDYVFTVGVDRVARVDRLRLDARVDSPHGTLPVVGLNQHAVPVGGIGIFTRDWGEADRGQTLCGSDSDRNAPCAPDRVEVLVRDRVVAAVGAPGAGRLPPNEIALLGREQGAAALRALQVGDPVQVSYALVPESGVTPQFAVGGSPILRDGRPTERLDDRERAPRSAAAHSPDGTRLYLVTVDGRQDDSVGTTLSELSALLAQLGAVDGMNLDGGGSSTLVFRAPGAGEVTIVNDPSDSSARLVPNGIGVFTG